MLAELLLVAALGAPAAQAPVPTPAAPASSCLQRPAVIGASLAAGFGAECTFAAALGASLRAPARAPLDLGDEFFFVSPLALGAQQVEAAQASEATLVVAIDFLFWFGYGSLDSQGGPIEAEAERLELLERGLALLEDFECPLLVADFPDMSGAVGKMITAAQMPQPATLELLSKRVRAWALARKHTLVLPLSELVKKIGTQGELRIGRHLFAAETRLLQRDQLHPTRFGLVGIAQLACDELVQRGLAAEGEFQFELAAVLEKLGQAQAAK